MLVFSAGCAGSQSRRSAGFQLATPVLVSNAECSVSQTANVGQISPQPLAATDVISKTPETFSSPQEANQVSTVQSPDTSKTVDQASFSTETSRQSGNGFVLDLPSALQMACGQNPTVNYARERIAEASAQHARAESLWLPTIRAGVNWNKHEGSIQDVAGTVFNTSRGSYYTGLGANAVGAGSPGVPGVAMNFHLADAIYQPKATEHVAASRQYAATAAEQDVMLQTALGYTELLRAHQELAIAIDIRQKAEDLAKLTKDYADSGQGLAADHDRALAELAVRKNDVLRATESTKTGSARLAQLLHLDPTVELTPAEATMTPLSLIDETGSLQETVASGLSHRPEVCEHRQLVAEACERLSREKNAPLLPSVLLGLSYGGLGGGQGDNFRQPSDRLDADAIAYWEVRNLGFGERAARAEARSRVFQAKWREVATLDRIAREIVEAHAQVASRRGQLPIAESGVSAATSSFERNSERIRNAQGLPLETLQSLQALSQARREYLRVVSDYNSAQFTMQRALGWATSHE